MFPTKQLKELLRKQARTVVLTGAGISAESGVPTFRGNQDSLWSKFDPRELASIDAFMAKPGLVWEWYLWRRKLIGGTVPNAGHEVLAKLQKLLPDFTLVTQNVDNLHQRAGSEHVIELHGNIHRNKCFDCGKAMDVDEFGSEQLPRCNCGGMIRPDVVWFGEMLPEREIAAAIDKSRRAELFLCIGTSAEVYPAADLPVLAKRSGAYLVEINPEETQISAHADEICRVNSGPALTDLWQDMNSMTEVHH